MTLDSSLNPDHLVGLSQLRGQNCVHQTQNVNLVQFWSVLWIVLACASMCLEAASPNPGEPIPAGDIRSEFGVFSAVFYFTPDPKAPTETTARDLAARLLAGVPFSTEPHNPPKPPFVGFEEENAPIKSFPVPDTAYFKHAGRGLTPDDIAAIQKTSRATRLVLVMPKEGVWKLGRQFTQFAHEFAAATGAFIWDSATRECFSREAWQERRLASWSEEQAVPDISRHITIHLYRASDDSPYLRAITLGMEKFALPDVVVERVIGGDNRPAGNLIDLVCQSLAEDPRVADGLRQPFRIAALTHHGAREHFRIDLKDGAKEEITLALLTGHPEGGDPDNSLLEIDFRNSPGSTDDERREEALSGLWGASDSIVGVKHDAELLAASKRARARLPELQTALHAGLPPGSRLLVKAPFRRDDEGNEWMWVEVMTWPRGAKIEGILQNDPFYIQKLKAGSKVRVNEADVFDYLLYRTDGTTEGNETGRLMEKQQGPTRTK